MAGPRRYRMIWQVPGAPLLLVVGIVARLGLGMVPLSLVLLVQQMTGRYAPAALVSGVYALALAAAGPVASRLADRVGPAPVLLVTAVAHPLAVAALLAASRGGASAVGLVGVAAALAGATFPPLTAAIRGAWNDLTEPGGAREHLRGAALAAETSLFEIVFMAGPLLVGVLVFIADATAALAAAGTATLLGTVLVARGQVLRARRPHPSTVKARGLGPLRVSGLPALLACSAGLGIGFGAVGVAVPAYTSGLDLTAAGGVAGILLGVRAIGSALSGVWFGSRLPADRLPRRLAWLLAAVAASFAFLP